MEKLLYPLTIKIKSYYLKVDEIHSLYIVHYGNINKPIILFLHGGPGASTDEFCSRFFDPTEFHIILFDQRGCGKSKPLGELNKNSTKYLIEDIEFIRKHIKANKIILFGGSWGATLSILYAIHYPENVSYYITRGLCLCDDVKGEVFTKSLSLMYPELWNLFIELSNKKNSIERLKEYHEEIKKKNKIFIDAWFNLEFKTLTPNPKDNKINFNEQEKYISSLFESLYYSNSFFLPKNYIIKNIKSIKHIPGIIIHGRLDVICNLNDSYKISKKLPLAKFEIIENAGHSYYDPLITKAMIKATKNIINIF
jgi:proline iminopeptidase